MPVAAGVRSGTAISVAYWTSAPLSTHFNFRAEVPVGTAAPKHFIVYRYFAGSSMVYLGFSLTELKEVRSIYSHFEDKERVP